MTAAELEAAVREMRKRCSLSADDCRKALRRGRGDVDAALAALIDAGALRVYDLNPDTVPVELLGRAEAHSMAGDVETAKNLLPLLGGMMGNLMDEIGAMTGEKVKAPALPKAKFPPKSKLPPEPPKLTDLKAMRALGMKVREKLLQSRAMEQSLRDDERRRREIRRDWPKVLKAPPFPPLKIEGIEQVWQGRDTLATWAGFKRGRKGAVDVEIEPPEGLEGTPESPGPRPLPAQVAAYQYLKENQDEVTGAILKAVFRYYTELREDPEYLGEDEAADPEYGMPQIKGEGDLKKLITPPGVRVLSYAKGGVAYVGFSMRCTWDEEHGLGVMTHKSRVVKVGQADVSFDHFAVKDDGGKPLPSA